MFFPTGSNMFNFLVVCFALSTPLVEGGDCEVGDSFCKGRFGNVYSCKTYQQSPTEVRYCNFINDWKTDAQCLCEDPHPHKDCKYGDDFCKDKYGITSRCELYGMYPEEIRKCKFVTWQVDSSCRCEKAPPTTPTPKPPACPNPKADDVCKENASTWDTVAALAYSAPAMDGEAQYLH
ncbi:hypothetical protein FOL47_008697 [Perkinsus chesapeaki]|uniref:Uncharacterized protein n=1 Tax=Perkinsus chesapeaki TaxID=330153 RepID=A0A7J6LCH6_PERCH|nr:hypothetical protein FOL47_008697 [Perkinsus chesapeaki]